MTFAAPLALTSTCAHASTHAADAQPSYAAFAAQLFVAFVKFPVPHAEAVDEQYAVHEYVFDVAIASARGVAQSASATIAERIARRVRVS